MIKTAVQMSTGEVIYIYDNIFSPADVFGIQQYIQTSRYGVGSKSYSTVNSKQGSFFKSMYNNNDLENLDLFTDNFKTILDDHMKGLELSIFWANITTHLTDSRFHCDSKEGKTILYYVNDMWDSDWGGETLFKNSENVLERAIEFKSNRAVIFDSFLPHKSAPLTITADMYRFVLAMHFRLPANDLK